MKKLCTLFSVLALVLLCAILLPIKAQAAEVASGTCGNDLTWVLDDAGTLTISGTGTMTSHPWLGSWANSWRTKIKSVILEDGVANIMDEAFLDCINLTSITIPASVKGIGDFSFEGCDSVESVYISDIAAWCTIFDSCLARNPLGNDGKLYLNGKLVTDLVIPEGVTEIGPCAFAEYDSLTSVTIPDSVTYIGEFAFAHCNGLVSINIGNGGAGDITIGSQSLIGCHSLTNFTINKSEENWVSFDEFAFDSDSLTSITIPKSTWFEFDSFFAPNLTTVYYGGTEADRDLLFDDSFGTRDLLPATWYCVDSAPAIIAQPQDTECALDEYAVFKVDAHNPNGTYQWQYKSPNSDKWFNSGNEGFDTATLRVQMKAYRNGYQYRCVLTTADGAVLTSDPATMTLQMPSVEIIGWTSEANTFKGQPATFTVRATGMGLTYQWYCSTDSWKTWNMVDCTAETLSFTADVPAWYKCKVTDGSGKVVWSKPAQLIVRIDGNVKTQPVDVECFLWDQVQFTAEAELEGSTYLWQYKIPGDNTWYNSYSDGYNTATVSLEMKAYRAGYQYRCQITDPQGRISFTEPANLILRCGLFEVLDKLQSEFVGAINTWFNIGVDVVESDDPVTYRWYYSIDGGETWLKSYCEGYDTNEIKVQMKPYRDGYLYRCVITSGATEVTTDATTLKIEE